jgi:hypothetical protein
MRLKMDDASEEESEVEVEMEDILRAFEKLKLVHNMTNQKAL